MSLRAVLVILFVQFVALEVRAVDAAQRVALFLIADDAALYARVSAELRAQGFEPIEVSVPAARDPFAMLNDAMRATHAGRALRIESSAQSVRLWIANLTTGKQIYRDAPQSPETADPAVVSQWAIEALRASAVAPVPLPATASVVVVPPAAPVRERTLALQLAAAALVSPGGFRPSAELVVGISWLAARPLGAELFLMLPTVPSRIEQSSGSTSIVIGMLAAGPMFELGHAQEARWSGQLGAGAALTLVRARGAGSDDYVGQTEHVVGGGPYGRAGVALRVWRALRLRADALVGAVFPKPVIYFADQRVADWGRPWIATALGMEAMF